MYARVYCAVLSRGLVSSQLKQCVRRGFGTAVDAVPTTNDKSAKHRRALYAGTFDPPSCGHLDIITRALNLCDNLVIAIAVNPSKKPMFAAPERAALLQKLVDTDISSRSADVKIVPFEGLIVECAKQHEVDFLVRGLRAYSDFEYEFRMALINRKLSGIETSFLMADEAHSHISSTLIRELARWKTTLPGFVPDSISDEVFVKLGVPYNPDAGSYGVKKT